MGYNFLGLAVTTKVGAGQDHRISPFKSIRVVHLYDAEDLWLESGNEWIYYSNEIIFRLKMYKAVTISWVVRYSCKCCKGCFSSMSRVCADLLIVPGG